MKISLEWLKEYVDLPADAAELVDVLPMLGLEVEEAEGTEAPSLDHVVVGEVLDKTTPSRGRPFECVPGKCG